MAEHDFSALLRHKPPLMPFSEASSLIYRANETLYSGTLKVGDHGLYVEHDGKQCRPGADRDITPVWNGIRPDNEMQAFDFVRWMEKKNRSKLVAVWIVMTAPDHFLSIPLLFGAKTYPEAFDGQSVLPFSNGIAAHRGALAFNVLDESREVVMGPGDLVIGELGSAYHSSTGFTYAIKDPLVIGQAANITDAAALMTYEPFSSSMFAGIHDLEDEEGKAIARLEPNDALMLVHDKALHILEIRGIRMYHFDDAAPYFEVNRPEEDGIYHVSDITLVTSRDWESGHSDLDIEADWALATPANLESFGFDRKRIEAELSVGHEIPTGDAVSLIEQVYRQELSHDGIG